MSSTEITQLHHLIFDNSNVPLITTNPVFTSSNNNNIKNCCLVIINGDVDCDVMENNFVFSTAAQGVSINYCYQDHRNHFDDNIVMIKQENNSDFANFCIDLIVKIMSYPVIWCTKLQPYTTCTISSLTKFEYTAPLMSLQEATFSTNIIAKIKNGFNLLHHQYLTFKATVHENITSALRPSQPGPVCNTYHENITSALRPAQPGPGCNTYHPKLNSRKLRLLCLKLKHTEIVQYFISRPLELTKFTTSYISRGGSIVLLLLTLHQLKKLQRSKEHKGVSEKCMSGSVPLDSNIYLYIYIVYTCDVLVTLQLFTNYIYISQNST